jgi:hypothetical protein
VLENRWRQGYAAIAMQAEQITGYTSVVPVYAAPRRAKLAQELGLSAGLLPAIDLYEFASGWTHPHFRRLGLSLRLRQKLLPQFSGPAGLCVSVGVGLGAAPVLERLGWRMLAWNEIPFASSLIGLPGAGPAVDPARVWQPPPGLAPYNGPPVVPSQQPHHPWEQYCHFLASDPALAAALNSRLEALMQGNLPRWLAVVAAVQTQPSEFGWKLIWFEE